MDKDSIPSFFIIGVQKSATSFMHSLLKQDMKISLPYRKETHFFSLNFHKNINWYLNMFHSKKYDIRGEVDPSYIHYPKSLENIKITTKDPKFIIIFRKPIDRAYSQYLMSKKRNYDKLTFNNALHEEKQRLLNDKNLFSFSNHSYMARGNYREQIIRCKKIFPKSKYLFIKFDDMINKNKFSTLKEIYSFLKIDFYENINFDVYKNMATDNKSELVSRFLYSDSIVRKLAKNLVPSYYMRYKIIEYIEKINSHKKINIVNKLDYSLLDRKFINWNNKQSLLLKDETGICVDDWIINE